MAGLSSELRVLAEEIARRLSRAPRPWRVTGEPWKLEGPAHLFAPLSGTGVGASPLSPSPVTALARREPQAPFAVEQIARAAQGFKPYSPQDIEATTIDAGQAMSRVLKQTLGRFKDVIQANPTEAYPELGKRPLSAEDVRQQVGSLFLKEAERFPHKSVGQIERQIPDAMGRWIYQNTAKVPMPRREVTAARQAQKLATYKGLDPNDPRAVEMERRLLRNVKGGKRGTESFAQEATSAPAQLPPDQTYEQREQHKAWEQILDRLNTTLRDPNSPLTPREKQVLDYHYGFTARPVEEATGPGVAAAKQPRSGVASSLGRKEGGSMSADQAAKLLGISRRTYFNDLARAQSKLREVISPLAETAGMNPQGGLKYTTALDNLRERLKSVQAQVPQVFEPPPPVYAEPPRNFNEGMSDVLDRLNVQGPQTDFRKKAAQEIAGIRQRDTLQQALARMEKPGVGLASPRPQISGYVPHIPERMAPGSVTEYVSGAKVPPVGENYVIPRQDISVLPLQSYLQSEGKPIFPFVSQRIERGKLRKFANPEYERPPVVEPPPWEKPPLRDTRPRTKSIPQRPSEYIQIDPKTGQRVRMIRKVSVDPKTKKRTKYVTPTLHNLEGTNLRGNE